jgi:hypothetical protein
MADGVSHIAIYDYTFDMTYPDEIEKELKRGREAKEVGNEGMTRVCARRAAGAAIRLWKDKRGRDVKWGTSAMSQLKTMSLDESFPEAVRKAAERLTTQQQHDHTMPFDNDPLDDAVILIEHLINEQ